ncbi:hypothetical protein T01_3836 [Trichinella spiralis]|uniref:Uncharacterized protein n=1 Tax=Trichinella spiralis TaxID=6334 RepID=A0A0V1ASA9_TRISP|nr:hypothetical protein T01_3836 [Trichinella spiralis]
MGQDLNVHQCDHETSGNTKARPVLSVMARTFTEFLRMIKRICLCQTLFAFLVTSHMLVKAILIQRESQQVINCPQLFGVKNKTGNC